MELSGFEFKDDNAIKILSNEIKKQYVVANVLSKYIFDNKKNYKISVYVGKDNNKLKQLLFIFKWKSNKNES